MLSYAKNPLVMRIHHTSPPDHQVTMALHAFALDVRQRTDGMICVDIVTKRTGRPVIEHSNYIASVTTSDIEAASMPTFMLPNIPEINFLMIPYFFTEADQIIQFPKSAAATMLTRKIENNGIKPLAWIHTTRSTVFTTKDKPIVHPEDFNDLKIATVHDFNRVSFEPVGAKPMVVYSPQIYRAVCDGKTNAIMTDVSSAIGLKFYELHRFATIAPFFSAYYLLFVSPRWLNDLPEYYRLAILAAAKQLESTAYLITEARAAAALDILREGGMIIHTQTEKEQVKWQKMMAPPAMDAYLSLSPDSTRLINLLEQ